MRRKTVWIGLLLVGVLLRAGGARAAEIDWQQVNDAAIARLQAYVRVDTTNPPGNETPAAELLRGWLAAEGIEAQLYDPTDDPSRRALVARLPGSSGRTIVLMSHSDVVPAVAKEWSHPPFAADIADGLLYGRGTLDTKGLGIMELMTMVLLHRQGITPRDSLLLLIEPDEEDKGTGIAGMLAKYPELFRDVRMVLNEGGSGTIGLLKPGQVIFFVQTAEKGAAWMKLTARGDTGHGSVPLPNNAVATMARALDRIAHYETPLHPSKTTVRLFATLADQLGFPGSMVMRHVDSPIVQTLFRKRLTERPLINAMLRTTVSLTGVHGGYKTNVIPSQVEATLDCRVTVGDSGDALEDATRARRRRSARDLRADERRHAERVAGRRVADGCDPRRDQPAPTGQPGRADDEQRGHRLRAVPAARDRRVRVQPAGHHRGRDGRYARPRRAHPGCQIPRRGADVLRGDQPARRRRRERHGAMKRRFALCVIALGNTSARAERMPKVVQPIEVRIEGYVGAKPTSVALDASWHVRCLGKRYALHAARLRVLTVTSAT